MSEDAPLYIKKHIDDVTSAELRDFAVIMLGLDGIKASDSRQDLLGKMAAAGYGLATISVPNQAVVAKSQEAVSSGGTRRVNEETGQTELLITINRSEKAGGSRPVPVGVNGRMMLIPRGKAVWVPESFVGVLENAVELHYPQYDADSDFLGGLKEPEMVQAYPFSRN